MRYAAYLCLADGTYRDLEQTFEARGPREAARQAFDQLDLHRDEEFPELLVVPDDQVHIFTRDDQGRAVTVTEDMPRAMARGPRSVVVALDPAEPREQQF
jgi:hypothetical protein